MLTKSDRKELINRSRDRLMIIYSDLEDIIYTTMFERKRRGRKSPASET